MENRENQTPPNVVGPQRANAPAAPLAPSAEGRGPRSERHLHLVAGEPQPQELEKLLVQPGVQDPPGKAVEKLRGRFKKSSGGFGWGKQHCH